MRFNIEHLDKLADLFIDLAKGLFLAGLVAPAISSDITYLISLKSVCVGIIFLYFSLRIISYKEILK